MGCPVARTCSRTQTAAFAISRSGKALAYRPFPDGFVFQGSWTESMRQLGNAVPVALAYAVAQSIREKLGGGTAP